MATVKDMGSRRAALGFAFAIVAAAGCRSADGPASEPVRALTGEVLARPSPAPDRARKLALDVERAEARLAEDPDDPERVIWLGRRIAYTGDYRRAIEVYSRGLAAHPENAKLLRHRGHRYITVRELDRAVDDLERAARLVTGRPDEVEPDPRCPKSQP